MSQCGIGWRSQWFHGRLFCLDHSFDVPPPAATGGDTGPRTEMHIPEQEYLVPSLPPGRPIRVAFPRINRGNPVAHAGTRITGRMCVSVEYFNEAGECALRKAAQGELDEMRLKEEHHTYSHAMGRWRPFSPSEPPHHKRLDKLSEP